MNAVEAKNITHSYGDGCGLSLDNISLTVREGELLAVLGQNGSGKSTLAKHLDALIPVQSGELTVAGLNAQDEENIWEIRRRCGMVFQNPDSQFVSSVVEEDIAFGLENYNIPEEEIPERVRKALALVGMSGYEKKATHMLSGGQKQRIALAGILVLEPDTIILDEATSMLDPEGRGEILDIIRQLHEKEHKTVIMITHNIEEAVAAERVILMKEGRILADGAARDILTSSVLLTEEGLMPTGAVRAYYDLKEKGIVLPGCPLTSEELVELLCRSR